MKKGQKGFCKLSKTVRELTNCIARTDENGDNYLNSFNQVEIIELFKAICMRFMNDLPLDLIKCVIGAISHNSLEHITKIANLTEHNKDIMEKLIVFYNMLD